MKITKPTKAPSLKRLRSKADGLWQQAGMKKWGSKCFCGKEAYCCHHYFPKGQYGHLRYDLDNAVPICLGDHFAIHTKHDTGIIMSIRTKRGEEWFKELNKKAQQTPSSYKSVGYYKKKIAEFEEYLEL
jgi:hypothetical protein